MSNDPPIPAPTPAPTPTPDHPSANSIAPPAPTPTSPIPHPTSDFRHPTSSSPLDALLDPGPDHEFAPDPNPDADLPTPADFVAALAAAHFDPAKIALTLTSHQLTRLMADPLVHTQIDTISAFKSKCLHIRQIDMRQRSMTQLDGLVTSSDDPVEKRRNATALSRACNPCPTPVFTRSPFARKHQRVPAERLRPHATPRQDLTPEQVLHHLSFSLFRKNSEAPHRNSGLATITAFCEHDATLNHQMLPTDDPQECIDALAHTSIVKLKGWTKALQLAEPKPPPPSPHPAPTTASPPNPPTQTPPTPPPSLPPPTPSTHPTSDIPHPTSPSTIITHDPSPDAKFTRAIVYTIPDKPSVRVTFHLTKQPVNTRHPGCWLVRSITTTTAKNTT